MKKQKQLSAQPAKSVSDKRYGKQDQSLPTVVQPEQKPTQKYTPEEAKKLILELVIPGGDLSDNLKKLANDLLPKFFHGSEKEKTEVSKKFDEKAVEVMMTLETDTHVALMESFNPQYRGLAKELSTQIIKDYNAATSAEKALSELIASAFIRVIDNSRRLNNDLGGPGLPITENKTKYLSMLSIQIDRANRQFLNALITLKQLKAPTIEMNIKTKNTFVAQNQQINANNPIGSNENNESK